jgi:integrase
MKKYSVRLRSNSPYFMADYTAADGTRRRVSTGKTNRHEAEQFLASLLAAEKLAREDRLTEARARELISEIVERSTGARLEFFTVRAWFDDWMAGKEVSKAAATLVRYRNAVALFLRHLGKKAERNIETLRGGDIATFFKAEVATGKSSKTCALNVKVVKMALAAAVRAGVLKSNPAANVEVPLAGVDSVEREVFSPDEVSRLIASADGDWPGVIRLSYFAGLRIGDCVNLKWRSVDLGRRLIEFTPRKTASRVRAGGKSKRIVVPIHPELEDFLSSMTGADGSPDAFLFPSLAGKTSAGRSGLSMSFSRLMERAGVDGKVKRGKRGAGRTIRSRTFHSLRHSFVSALANAGVPLEHRRLLAGHVEPTMTEAYTHTDVETLRAGVDKLPGLGG